MPERLPTFDDVLQAMKRIAGVVHHTPVMTSRLLNEISGAELFFKCENFQRVGAFKFRGASNAVMSLPQSQLQKGVATHSSGNHAAALALAAQLRGTSAYIVMPENSPAVKVAAVRDYGARITFCKPTLKAREETLQQVVEKTGAVFIHPYNNPNVIAGQGTAALELLEQVGELDVVLAPVGGGGLMSGTAITVRAMRPSTFPIGAEPANADDAYRSLKAGRIIPPENPNTIADGLRTALGPLTFAILSEKLERIFTVKEETIVRAMRLIWERMKIIVEPSAAVPFAAVLENRPFFEGKRVGIILSGGNVDLEKLPWST
ncbi:MAG TPA: pyridoxal-phosphate dependent enzyme [Calditrichae bacterium]|nr:pyridoxal-phosphate dependent enzyme [Calditrichia bacterium]